MNEKKFYVTTPIYYVTACPHLGSLYSTVIADVASRWNKLQGKKVFFLTGTDEHGQKVAQAAYNDGQDPQSFVDSFIADYKKTWNKYGITYSDFIRTTESRHVTAVQKWLTQLQESGDIYKGMYVGWYCTPCETFVTDKESQNDIPLCGSCHRATEKIEEETYFFKLSAYQDKLLDFYENNPNFIVPKERAHEVINFVKSGLKDLSISRSIKTVQWGIPFPNDSQHVAYVWADALNNYITAIGYGAEHKQEDFSLWWPADLHVLGKDIVRFHAIYWPAFLMASGLSLPKQLLVHGWITVDGKKMSKSLGNVVDPNELYDAYGADAVRYYLMRKTSIAHDSIFSLSDLEQTISSDLANDLGNLLNRVVMLAYKYNHFEVPAQKTWLNDERELRDSCLNTIEEVESYMNEYLYHRALARIWKFIHEVNTFFHSNEPWKLARSDVESFIQVISAACHSLYDCAVLLWPIMPNKMENLLAQLGFTLELNNNHIEDIALGRWGKAFMLKKGNALFEKPEKKVELAESKDGIKEKTPSSAVEKAIEIISIDDFAKVQLIVGTIIACEPVPNSVKLLKLQVDCGKDIGIRQVLSGIRQWYAPQDLIDKQGVFVLNLKPRKMAGLESQGMMLFVPNADNELKMVTISGSVENGAPVH